MGKGKGISKRRKKKPSNKCLGIRESPKKKFLKVPTGKREASERKAGLFAMRWSFLFVLSGPMTLLSGWSNKLGLQVREFVANRKVFDGICDMPECSFVLRLIQMSCELPCEIDHRLSPVITQTVGMSCDVRTSIGMEPLYTRVLRTLKQETANWSLHCLEGSYHTEVLIVS